MWYILDDNNIPIASTATDFIIWEEKFPEKRIVKQDIIEDICISTVFLGLNHSYNTPLWWETMIFGGENDMYQERYSTYEKAFAGHEIALNLVKKQVV